MVALERSIEWTKDTTRFPLAGSTWIHFDKWDTYEIRAETMSKNSQSVGVIEAVYIYLYLL